MAFCLVAEEREFLWVAPDAWCEGKHTRLHEILCTMSHTHTHTKSTDTCTHIHYQHFLIFALMQHYATVNRETTENGASVISTRAPYNFSEQVRSPEGSAKLSGLNCWNQAWPFQE